MRAVSMLPVVASVCLASPALAQSANYTSVETVAGASTQIGYYASAKKDCTPERAPTLRVLTPPRHGMLSVRRGSVTTNKIPSCPNLQAPAQIVFYEGRAGYAGADEVVYEVTNADGGVAVYTVSIAVKEGPKPPPAPTPGQRL